MVGSFPRGALAASLVLVSVAAGRQQASDELTDLLDRLRTGLLPDSQVEVAEHALVLLDSAPDEASELLVRFELGSSLLDLEQFAAARENLELAVALARTLEDDASLFESLGNLAVANHRLGELEESIEAGVEAIHLAREGDRPDVISTLANIVASSNLVTGNYEEAIHYYSMALEASAGDPLENGLARVLNNIGVAHMELGQLERALEFFDRALAAHEQLGDERGIAASLANRGDAMHLRGESRQALPFLEQALEKRLALGLDADIALSHHSLGVAYRALGEHTRALEHFEPALDMREELGLLPEVAATLAEMTHSYAALDRVEEAEDAAERGFGLSQALQLKKRRIDSLDALISVHVLREDWESALVSMDEARVLERELRNLESHREFAEFRNELEVAERERASTRQIELLRTENQLQEMNLQHQRLVRNSAIGGGLLFGCLAFVGWSRYHVKRRANTALGKALQSLREANEVSVARGVELEQALAEVKRLEGLLPICAKCKSIRDSAGIWRELEEYISGHTDAGFSHGICPRCVDSSWPSAEPDRDEAPTG